MIVAPGAASVVAPFFVKDSSSTIGAGLSIAHNAAGLVAEYRRDGEAAWTAVALSAGVLGTWSAGGFIADGVLAGAYEIGWPDAAFAAGASFVLLRLRGAANMLATTLRVDIDATAAAIKLKTDLIGTGSALVVSPVDPVTGNLVLSPGVDYVAEIANSLKWNKTAPDLTNWTIRFGVGKPGTELHEVYAGAGFVESPGTLNQKVGANVTRAQFVGLESLINQTLVFSVVGISPAGGFKLPLVEGSVLVRRNYAA